MKNTNQTENTSQSGPTPKLLGAQRPGCNSQETQNRKHKSVWPYSGAVCNHTRNTKHKHKTQTQNTKHLNRKHKSEWRYSGAVRRTETWRTWPSRPNAGAPHEARKVFLVKYNYTNTQIHKYTNTSKEQSF